MTARLRVIATGDAIINRRISSLSDADFLDLRDLVAQTDVALTNFEATTPQPPLVPAPTHGLSVSAPEFVIDELRWMGFDLYNLANNHATAYGWQGYADTLAAFAARNLVAAGGGHSLAEARAPRYVDGPFGRVALVGATMTNADAVLAADAGGGTAGRPGANPLRFSLEYRLDEAHYGQLVEIDEAIGTAHARRAKAAFGPLAKRPPPPEEGRLRFLGATFRRTSEPGVRGHLHEADIAALERSVIEARGEADLVAVSIHCHEGENGEWNADRPPDFLVEAAHRAIEAGADLIAGHGPHRLRGIEIFGGKPILYSLGNFFLQLETVAPVPPEAMEAEGLPPNAAPAEYHDRVWMNPDGSPIGFAADPVWFESLAVECEFDGRAIRELRLHPVELGMALPRQQRGVPRLVDASRGTPILERVAVLSRPFGTEFRIDTSNGRATARVILPGAG